MTKEFNNLDELQKYYNKETNTYVFKEDDEYIDLVVFNFDLSVEANIDVLDIRGEYIKVRNIDACDIKAIDINAEDIKARNIDTVDINALDITAGDIRSWNIEAENILYHAVCYAHCNIKCKSIKGRLKNSKHFVLDGKLEVSGKLVND